MQNEHLDLAHEFPEYQEKIRSLKNTDNHFKKLFEQYDQICKGIYRSEKRIELLSELEEEKLRKQRLVLKDQLYAMLSR